MKNTVWPADVQDEADALSAASAAEAGVLYQCSRAGSDDEAAGIFAGHDFNMAGNAASAMRLALGLPIDR